MRTEKRARRSSRLLVLATLAALAGLSGQVLMGAAHGVLDTTFSSDGKTTVDFGDDDRARAVVVQPDGKVIVVGTNDDGLANFAVARFNADGSLDTSFSSDGQVQVTLGASDFAQAVALQTDGKIVVAGYTNASGNNDFAVARFNADGTQDTTFSGDGEFTIDFGNDDQATSVAIQDDGNIVVAGFTDNGSADFAVARVTTSGVLDVTFDTDGKRTFTFGGVDKAYGVAIDSSSRIVMVGSSGADMAVARLEASGGLDLNFDTDGKVTTDFGDSDVAHAVAIQPDGRIVVAGTGASLLGQGCVMRLTTSGALDTSFSTDGKVTVSMSGYFVVSARSVVLLHNGKIAIGGYATVLGGADFAAAVLDSTGVLDTTFDSDGKYTVSFATNDQAWGIGVQPDGALVLAGFADGGATPSDFAVLRVGADTPVDVSFDSDGRQEFVLGSTFGDHVGRAVLVDPDGKTVVAGSATFGTSNFGAARFTTAGVADTTLGGDGDVNVSFGGDDAAMAIARQADGKLVLAGYTNRTAAGAAGDYNFAVLRLNSDGTLDTTFNDIASPTASNGDGRLVIDLNGDDRATAIAIQPDGKILVVGSQALSASPDFAVVRLNTDGTFDTSLSIDGKASITFGFADYATCVGLQTDGKIVIGGYSNASGSNDFAVVRLAANGALDSTFNDVASPTGSSGDGRLLVSFGDDDRAQALAMQSDGKIVLAGAWDGGAADFAIVRLTTAGVLDTTFSGDGKSNGSFGPPAFGGAEYATGVVVEHDGQLLVTGYSDAGSGLGVNDFAIVRLSTAGLADQSFGNGGELLIDFGDDDQAYGVALDPSTGQAVVAGSTTRDDKAVVVRLSAAISGPAPTLPSMTISDVTLQEGNAGSTNAVFTVTLSTTPAVPVSVLAATSASSASAGSDFTAVSAGVLFLPGVTSQTVSVPVIGDTTDEIDESFTVGLSGATGATIADATGAGLIRDDDLAVAITSPTAAAAFNASQALVMVGGAATDLGGITSVTWVNAAAGSGTADGTTSWTAAIPVNNGANVVTVTAHDANGFTSTDTVTINVSSFVTYLAEGATSDFLDTRLAFLNSTGNPTTATLTFSPVGAAVVTHNLPVPAHSRATLDPKTVAGMAVAEFSTKVESSQPLVVDRSMSWNASAYGAHAETSVPAPATTWYLAEGATHSGFDLFYLLQNPAATSTTVRVRYLRPSGDPLEKDYVLPPASRTNIWVNTESFSGLGLALASTDVSAVITSLDATPIIVERALYLSSQGRLFNAGHESAGVTSPALQWFLAEGSTGTYFDLFVLIANPNSTAADVRVTYLLTDGRTFTRTLTAPANSRSNIWVDTETFDGGASYPLADVAVSTTVESENGVGIIVERALWWPGDFATWHEAHNSAGSTTTGTIWGLAEGEVAAAGDARGDETYILIANTSAFAGEASVTLFFEDGTTSTLTYPLPARSRTNVAVGPDFGAFARGKRFGAIVESTGSPAAQIVVERAMYWNSGGVTWAAGTNALATRLQ